MPADETQETGTEIQDTGEQQTQEETQELSLNDELEAAFASPEGEETPAETPAEETAEVKEETEPEPLSAPEHWPEETRTLFEAAPREWQEWALKRDSEVDNMIREKTEGISEFRKTYDPVDKIFEPYRNQLIMAGLTPADVISRWAAAEQMLQNEPVKAIQYLMQQYNISQDALSAEEVSEDPDIAKLRNEINALRQDYTTRQQTDQQQSQEAISNQIQQFVQEKDESGNLTHPYFEDVTADIVGLAKAEWALGRKPDLNNLYERAVWANPETRAKLQDAQQKAASKAAEKEAQRKAKEAKAAAASITGAPSGTQVIDEDLSVEDSLRRAWDSNVH